MTRKSTKPSSSAEASVIAFADQAAWKKWLDRNHASSPGVWIQLAKKGSGIPSVAHPEALDAALCYGWIDGQRKRRDEKTFLQRFTPRGARSIWSTINRDKAVALSKSGQMRPAGLAEIERAEKDGRWKAAYKPQATAEVPPDLPPLPEARRR